MTLFGAENWALIERYLKSRWRQALLLALFMGMNLALKLLNPQILRYFIDSATAQAALDLLFRTGLLYVGLAIVQQLLAVAEVYVGEDLGWSATNDLRADLTEHVLGLDMPFHNAHPPGELIERIDGDVTLLANFFSQFVIRVLGNFLFILGVLVVLFVMDWRFGLALTLFMSIAAVILNNIRQISVEDWKEARQSSAELYGFIEERLNGVEDLRASGATPYVMRRLYEAMSALLHKFRRARLKGNIAFITAGSLFAFAEVLALGLGAFLYFQGAITLGMVYVAYYYTQLLNGPFDELTKQLQDFQRASASISRLTALRTLQPTIQDGPGVQLPAGPLSVTFDQVDFTYDSQLPVLNNVSFHLEAGQTLGVLGVTGSGKTSIARLLMRLYDPTGGAVRLGGHDIQQARLADLKPRLGMVTQDVQLFRGTIRDNLTLFRKSLSDAQLLEVFHQLGLSEWYQRLPQGLDTRLDGKESGLSAGEAQLLAFARLFLREPSLVILDEASSRLDPATEQFVQQAVQRLLANRTGVIIAHHLGTVMQADWILILEKGQVREFGERAQLASDPSSRFAQLLQVGWQEVAV